MKLHHVAIIVSDLVKSVEFYTKHFGLVEVRQFERPDLKGKAVLLEAENLKIELWEFEDVKKTTHKLDDLKVLGIRHIAFAVSEIETKREQFIKAGLQVDNVCKGASGRKYCFLSDLDGISIELYQE